VSAHHDLFKTYDEWRDWTVLEGDAIRSSDWPKVNSCQRAKLELQGRIIRYTEAARAEVSRSGVSWSEIEKRLRPTFEQLANTSRPIRHSQPPTPTTPALPGFLQGRSGLQFRAPALQHIGGFESFHDTCRNRC